MHDARLSLNRLRPRDAHTDRDPNGATPLNLETDIVADPLAPERGGQHEPGMTRTPDNTQ